MRGSFRWRSDVTEQRPFATTYGFSEERAAIIDTVQECDATGVT